MHRGKAQGGSTVNLCPRFNTGRPELNPGRRSNSGSDRPITKFYNGDDVDVIAEELRLTKTRPTSFYKKQCFARNNDNRCK